MPATIRQNGANVYLLLREPVISAHADVSSTRAFSVEYAVAALQS